MRLICLGHRGVGKTTYTASMYKRMQKPVHGFSLSCSRGGDHNRLLELDAAIQRGQYPPGTQDQTSYAFHLQHKGSLVERFDWIDVRGQSLNEKISLGGQARLLSDTLEEVDGVLIFLDSEILLNNPGQIELELGRIAQLVMQFAANAPQGKIIPVVLVLTKIDLIQEKKEGFFQSVKSVFGGTKDPDMTKPIARAVLAPLSDFCGMITESKGIVGGVIPTYCSAKSFNVEWPTLFTVAVGLSDQMRRLDEEIEELQDGAREARSKDTIWDRVKSTVKGESSWNEIAKRRLEEAERKHRKLLGMHAHVQLLLESFKKLPDYHFFDVKEHEQWV
jgi:hypothetical protein